MSRAGQGGSGRTVVLPIPDSRFELNAEVARDVMAAAPDGTSYYGRGGDLPHPDEGPLQAAYFRALGLALNLRALIDEVGTAGRVVRQTIDAAMAEASLVGDEAQRLAGLLAQYRAMSRGAYLQIHWRGDRRVSLNGRWHGDSLADALAVAVADLAKRQSPQGG